MIGSRWGLVRTSCGLIVALAALMLVGCETVERGAEDPLVTGTTPTVQAFGDAKYYASDEPLKLGIEHFNRGHYGLAEPYFRDAIEKTPKDLRAWIGLAASYDRLARFELADRAYAAAVHLGGETPATLNNLGYSYMLRGDLKAARAKFMKALAGDPDNPKIVNNLRLLNASYQYIERSVDR